MPILLVEAYKLDRSGDRTDTGHRWIAVGGSCEGDSLAAGRAAAGEALAGPDPKLLITYCADSHDAEAVLAGIHSVAGDVPLIGCSTAGEISSGGPGDNGVVVTAIGGPGISAATAVSDRISGDLHAAGAEVARSIERIEGCSHSVLILLTDGLAGNQQEIVRGAYSTAGAGVPLVGGCAGDDLKMERTKQFHGHQVLDNAVVAAALGSDAPLGIGVRHGWRRVGEPMLVSRSGDNLVYELDDRPALDVYLERLDAPAEAHTDAASFTRFAQTHPLGNRAREGEEHVRFIGAADFDERALVTISEVPQGGLAWLMEGSEESVLEATTGACDDALAGLEGRAPIGLMAFDCIARRGVLGEQGIQQEVARIRERSAAVPVSGFYTYGEIARTRGVAGFHNQTLVLLAVS